MNLATAISISIVIIFFSTGVGIYTARYRSSVTEMLGMMIGMTQGMMTGIAVGYFVGATTDMFVSNLVGIFVGLIFGIVFGRVGGLMGMMDGGMGGMMGGMMGAMLSVMLQYQYNGKAIIITGFVMIVIYLGSMVALVSLVRRSAVRKKETDPVCNMKVDPENCLQHTFQNQTYYFCGPSCQQQFTDTPGLYLNK